MMREDHQAVLELLSQFNYNPTAFSRLTNHPECEAFWLFENQRDRLLHAIILGSQFADTDQVRLLPFLKPLGKSVGAFGKTVAELCLQEIRDKSLEDANLQQERVRDLLQAIVKIRADLEGIVTADWIKTDWDNAPELLDEGVLFERILSDTRKRASEEVKLIALIGGKKNAGVAELTIRRIEKSDSTPKFNLVGRYAPDPGDLDWLETSVLPSIRNALVGDAQAIDRLDESAFQVKLEPTLATPANSQAQAATGPSIGLPIAIAIYSLVSKYRLDPNITATGIIADNGDLIGVDEIGTKIEKLACYNRIVSQTMAVKTLFGAAIDWTQIKENCDEHHLAIRPHLYRTLEELLLSRNLRVDPFNHYLTELINFEENDALQGHDHQFYREEVYQKSTSTESPAGAQIFPIPHGRNPQPVAQYMAKLFAQSRRKRFKSGESLSPVPVLIALDTHQKQPLIPILQTAFADKIGTQKRLWQELRAKDAFVFICYGSDALVQNLCRQKLEFFPNSEQLDPNQRLIVVARNWHQMEKCTPSHKTRP